MFALLIDQVVFLRSSFSDGQDMETTKVTFDGRLDEEDVVRTFDRMILGLNKKNEILPFLTTWAT